MNVIDTYRAHAEDCVRQAHADSNDGDRPLWLTLAQSWLQLAEHADRIHHGLAEDDDRDAVLADTETVGQA